MKYVKLELNHTGRVYEYATELPLETGHCYKVTTDGWTPPMRGKVVSVSKDPEYKGRISTILTATEVDTF